MIFLKGLWHGLKVMAIAGYWLMTIYFVWSALILLSRDWRPAVALLLMVAGLFPLRGVLARRMKSPGMGYVAAFAVYLAVFVIMYLHTGAAAH